MFHELLHIPHHTAEYKYIDIMHRACNLYASWEPCKPVRVGDYGKLLSDYSFSVEGNIFAEGIAQRLGIDETENAEDNVRFIHSEETEERTASFDAEAGHGPLQFGFKKSFKISSAHGAVLAMVAPRHHSLTFPGRLTRMLTHDRKWAHRVLVTELYTCESYARLYAPRQERVVELGLHAAPPAGGKVDAELRWHTTAQSCDFKHRDVKASAQVCYPLFKLVGKHHHLSHGPYTEVRDDGDDESFEPGVAAIGIPGIQSAFLPVHRSSSVSSSSSASSCHSHATIVQPLVHVH